MRPRHFSLWIRWLSCVMVLAIYNAYGGGHQLAQARERQVKIAAHNEAALASLAAMPALTEADVARRKALARQIIAASRAPMLARQHEGLKQLRKASGEIWQVQDEANLRGLAAALGDVTQQLRDAREARLSGQELVQLGQVLWFQRSHIARFTAQLEERGHLPGPLADGLRRVVAALDGLGARPHDVTAPKVEAALSTLDAVLRAQVQALRTSRMKPGSEARVAIDPLTGRWDKPTRMPVTRPLVKASPWPLPVPADRLEALYEGVPDATTSARAAALGTPTADDLKDTTDVVTSADIEELALSLGGDPLRIYNWVARNVDLILYNGSLYGSVGTLHNLAGNDVDQASLLIALLRASGISARYETGTVEIPAAKVPGLTGIQDVATAATALNTQGIPTVVVYSGSGPYSIKLQHTWVRAYVPYGDYRGVAGSTATGASQWVALAPALKSYELVHEVDIAGDTNFDLPGFLSGPTATSPRQAFENSMRQVIASTGTRCETLDQAIAHRVNQTAELPLLPTQLPYPVVGSTTTASALSDSFRNTVTVELMDSWGEAMISHTVSLPAIYGKRLAVTFPSGSGIYSSITGVVKPTLSLDGTVLAQGYSMNVGYDVPTLVTITSPGVGGNSHTHELVAGGTYIVNAYMGPIAEELLAQAKSYLESLKGSGAAANQIDLAVAWLSGLTYYHNVEVDDAVVYGYHAWMPMITYEAITGTSITPTYFWGVPSGAQKTGYMVDAESLFATLPLVGTWSQAGQAKVAELAGYGGSFHEHRVWEETITTQALAATNILQIARTQGQTLHYMDDPSDYAAVASRLQHDASVESQVQDALNAGNEVVISDKPIKQGNKTMSGYVLFDPDTGAGQYLISGGLGGGETTGEQDFFSWLASLLGPEEDIQSRVNMADGSLLDDKVDLDFFAHGRSMPVQRSFNSEQTRDAELGPGWAWNYGERLFEGSNGDVTRLDSSAKLSIYTRNSDGTYKKPLGSFDVLEKLSAGGWKLSMMMQKTWLFDAGGRITKETDRYGNVINFVRDGSGNLDKLTDGSGALLLDLTTDSAGHITRMADPTGRKVDFSYTSGRLTGVTDPNGRTWTYSWSSSGRMVGKVEPEGQSVTYGYDGDGNLNRYTTPTGGEGFFAYDTYNKRTIKQDPEGGETLYGFTKDGLMTEHIDPVGNKTSLEYASSGLPSKVSDARGGTTTMAYDANGNPTSVKDPSGAQTTMSWDSQNRPLSKTDEDGTSAYTYDDTGRSYKLTDSNGDVETFKYNSRGQITEGVDSDGVKATYTYDTTGKLTGSTDGNGKTTSFQQDGTGRFSAITSPEGNTRRYNFDAEGRVSKVTEADGSTWEATWTAFGQMGTVKDPTGNTVHFEYDRHWHKATTDPEGRTTRVTRDGQGRVIKTIDWLGNQATQRFDAAGRMIESTDVFGNSREFGFCADVAQQPCDEIDPLGNLIQRTLDSKGRVVAETTTLGTTSFVYDAQGRVTSRTDALGNVTEMEWDGSDQLAKLTDPLGHVTRYAWSARGKLLGVTDATGSTTTYTRDKRGQVTAIIDALGRVTSQSWDGEGRLTSRTDDGGRTTSWTYDKAGRATAALFHDGSSLSWTYDARGRKTRSTSEAADLEFVYGDALGRMSKTINHTLDQELTYTYNGDTYDRASVTRPDGTQRYSYDRYGRVTQVTLPSGEVVTMRYDRWGRLTEKRFPNGMVQTDTWDAWSRLTSRLVKDRSGIIVAGYSYTWDALGRKLSARDTQNRTTSYRYDQAGRLIEEKTSTLTRAFTWDEVGNRLSVTENGTQVESSTYDETHRLTTRTTAGGTTTYSYDDAGRLAQAQRGSQVTTYEYNGAGQLTQMSAPGEMPSVFTYDAEGRRVYRSDARGEAHLLYDMEDMVAELDDAGGLLRSYVHGPGIDDPLALTDHEGTSPRTLFYHPDGAGNVIALSGAGGGLTHTYRYDAFGQLAAQTGDDVNTLLWASRPRDPATGTYDFRARELDPSLGRFLQSDPRTFASFEHGKTDLASRMADAIGADMNSMLQMPGIQNAYAWPGGDPLNMMDPSGQSPVLISMLIFAILFAILFAGIILYLELQANGGNWDAVDWGAVAMAALYGAVIGAILGFVIFGPLSFGPMVQVTRWGGFGSGNQWVMVGGNTWRNWLMSGTVRYRAFSTGQTMMVPRSALRFPPGWEWFKGFLGQRILTLP